MSKNFWYNKKVLVTGHTGFKGTWLSIWLKMLGAKVYGISLPPVKNRNIFSIVNLKRKIDRNIYLDINNKKKLQTTVKKLKPQIIFHLAAQPLVIESFKYPLNTIQTNILGTANLLEVSRKIKTLKTIIVITTDKVYANLNKKSFFKENDKLGGDDIYSFSKVSVEMLVNSYRQLYFKNDKQIFTFRAGNVIGGGDWSENRLIPDYIKAYEKKKPFLIRNPHHVRPWQHVMECLYGYILSVEKLYLKKTISLNAINFGPKSNNLSTVDDVINIILNKNEKKIKINLNKKKSQFFEKSFLGINSSLAKKKIGWSPILNLNDSIDLTINWYKNYFERKEMYQFTCQQIRNYITRLK